MFIFPLIATAVSFIFSALLFKQYLERKRPYQLAWALALIMFGVAALAETLATVGSWNELLVKTYYVFGATLVVGYLALGTLYVSGDFDAGGRTATFLLGRRFNVLLSTALAFSLWFMIYGNKMLADNPAVAALVIALYLTVALTALLAKEKVPAVYLGVLLIASTLAVYGISQGQIDPAKLAQTKGWEALERTPELKTGSFSLNVIGSFILIIGALQSTIGLLRKKIMRDRALGNGLIAVGVLIVAGGGTLGGMFGLGGQAAISAPMAAGIVVMFLGFKLAGRQANTAPAPSPTRAKSGSPA
jgi:hypothetical protein